MAIQYLRKIINLFYKKYFGKLTAIFSIFNIILQIAISITKPNKPIQPGIKRKRDQPTKNKANKYAKS